MIDLSTCLQQISRIHTSGSTHPYIHPYIHTPPRPRLWHNIPIIITIAITITITIHPSRSIHLIHAKQRSSKFEIPKSINQSIISASQPQTVKHPPAINLRDFRYIDIEYLSLVSISSLSYLSTCNGYLSYIHTVEEKGYIFQYRLCLMSIS